MGELEQLLFPSFPERIRRGGRQYVDAGRVRILQSSGAAVSASIVGTGFYDVRLTRDSQGVLGTCSCPSFGDESTPCTHLWALALECDRRGLLGGRSTGANAPEPAWLRRVRRIERAAGARPSNPWIEVAQAAQRIVYALNVAATLSNGGPAVEAFRQTLSSSGTWKGQARVRSTGVEFPPADRQLLAEIDAPRAYFSRYENEGSAGLLPALCATGRFFLLRDGALGEVPLDLDPGEPWVFGLAFDLENESCVVSGYLERGEERRPLHEPVLLLASGWVVFEKIVARLDVRDSMEWIADLRRDGPLKVPGGKEGPLLQAALAQPQAPLLSGNALPRRAAESPRVHLRVKSQEGSELGCHIFFDYNGTLVSADDPAGTLAAEGGAILRDRAAERAAMRRFQECGGLIRPFDRPPARVGPRRLPPLVRALLAEGWTVEADGKRQRAGGAFHLQVRSGIDWFELEGAMRFDGQEAALPELLAAARAGAKWVPLGDGSVGLLPEDWLARWGFLDALSGGGAPRVARGQGWILDALLAGRPEVSADAAFAELRSRINRFEGILPRAEHSAFRGELRPYQRQALGWFAFLREMGLGGCLADDMGLGKTVQVLALLLERREGGKPSLVVAPKSLVFNWISEARRFAPQLRTLDYTGPGRKDRLDALQECDLVVTTYGTLRRDITEFPESGFDYAILDEAQMIKNPRSVSAKAARLLRSDHRLALTGTPIENHLGDLWSILEFLNPGFCGRVEAFRALAAAGDGEARDRLARALRPFFLRRTKAQVLPELPEKCEQVIYCDLEGKQRRAYDEVRDHARSSLLAKANGGGLARIKMHVLEALLRLRQVACHPGLVDRARAGEPCAKLEALLPRIEEIIAEGHRALIFSQFTSFLAILRERLDERKIAYEYLDGQTRRREEKVRRFQTAPEGACPLFLVSLKAGGFGLNLTAADYVFLLDPWWNPAVETQAVDRAHRLGQTRNVMAYRVIGRDTVEERVLELQARKREMVQAVLGGDQSLLEGMTKEDLELLLS